MFTQEVLRSLRETESIGVTHQKGYPVGVPEVRHRAGARAPSTSLSTRRAGLALARTLSAFRRVRSIRVTLELVTGLCSAKIDDALESLVNASIVTRDWSGRSSSFTR